MGYGMDHSRYAENKRAVKDKDLGPLVKTVMTRCIHCTRCIRFITEVAGVPDLGATARGEHMEVGTYVEKALQLRAVRQHHRPLPGRRADLQALCLRRAVVGAGEDRQRRRAGRGRRQHPRRCRGPEVLRILPRLNEDVNEEWLGDKSRFAVDGLKRRRLDRPWVRRDGKLARGDLAGGLRRHRGKAARRRRRPHRRRRRRSVRRRKHAGAEGPDGGAGLAQPRLPAGRRRGWMRRGATFTPSTPRSPASRRPTRC